MEQSRSWNAQTPARHGRSIGLLLVVLSLTGMGACAADDVTVEDAWIRAAPPGAMSLAGYMTIRNTSNEDVSIVGVSSDYFGMAMIHMTIIEDGVARMQHQEAVTVPAGGSVSLEPNGLHLMLMRPEREFEPGETLTLGLQLESGESLEVAAPVRPLQP